MGLTKKARDFFIEHNTNNDNVTDSAIDMELDGLPVVLTDRLRELFGHRLSQSDIFEYKGVECISYATASGFIYDYGRGDINSDEEDEEVENEINENEKIIQVLDTAMKTMDAKWSGNKNDDEDDFIRIVSA